MSSTRKGLLTAVGPGMLVAATGVGAGDLATAALTGSRLGLTILWAVVAGAFVKFVLNEGLTRWQLATGETLLEGAMRRLGRPAQYIFLAYLLAWSFMVAAALMSASGIAAHAILPIADDPSEGKIVYGALLSLVGLAMVRIGGYRLFEKVMGFFIAVMFLTVLITAILLKPPLGAVLKGLALPSIPDLAGNGLSWTIALMGGVGGTVTVLCYGYWIREEGRGSAEDLAGCRFDLGVAYAVTALFGMAMVVIGSAIEADGKGATLVIRLADRLGGELGTLGKWAFLIGAFGAIFSSLLGVWQSVPYLFSDLWGMMRAGDSPPPPVSTDSAVYRWFLYGLALLPMAGLWVGFARMQKTYAVFGAVFMPMLALVLLLLNGRTDWIGRQYRNRPLTTILLLLILIFFAAAGYLAVA